MITEKDITDFNARVDTLFDSRFEKLARFIFDVELKRRPDWTKEDEARSIDIKALTKEAFRYGSDEVRQKLLVAFDELERTFSKYLKKD